MSAARDLLTLLADAYNRHDLDGIRALYAPGARVNDTALDAALATHERFFSFLPDVKAELRAAAADDAVVIAELTLHGTNTGPLPLGPVYRTIVGTDADVVPPTGRTVAVPVVLVIEEDGGRIVTERQHLDSLRCSPNWACCRQPERRTPCPYPTPPSPGAGPTTWTRGRRSHRIALERRVNKRGRGRSRSNRPYVRRSHGSRAHPGRRHLLRSGQRPSTTR